MSTYSYSSGKTGFRVVNQGPTKGVIVSNAKKDGSYRSFYYEWLTPGGKPLPKSEGGGLKKHTPPPSVAELFPPSGAGVLRLHGPLERRSVKIN